MQIRYFTLALLGLLLVLVGCASQPAIDESGDPVGPDETFELRGVVGRVSPTRTDFDLSVESAGGSKLRSRKTIQVQYSSHTVINGQRSTSDELRYGDVVDVYGRREGKLYVADTIAVLGSNMQEDRPGREDRTRPPGTRPPALPGLPRPTDPSDPSRP